MVFFENCILLGYYAAGSGNFLLMFWDYLSFPSSKIVLIGIPENIQ
jgi:hypothetical protein